MVRLNAFVFVAAESPNTFSNGAECKWGGMYFGFFCSHTHIPLSITLYLVQIPREELNRVPAIVDNYIDTRSPFTIILGILV